MKQYDFQISFIVWLLSIVGAVVWIPALFVVCATTFNLWHQRRLQYDFGIPFETRVRAIYQHALDEYDIKLSQMDQKVQDSVDAQVKLQSRMR